jgi:hypothetical protein
VTPADVAWKLYREGPGHIPAALELARGIIQDVGANPDEVAKAGTLLFAAGAFDDAERARAAAVAGGAAPGLLAYLDTACALRAGDGRGARRALASHLAQTPDPLHPDMPWLATAAGSPRLAWHAARRARLPLLGAVGAAARALVQRLPRRNCRIHCSL